NHETNTNTRARASVEGGSTDTARERIRLTVSGNIGLLNRPRLEAGNPEPSAPAPVPAPTAPILSGLGHATLRPSRAALARRGGRLMPEWPDLHVVRGRLEKALVGHEIVLIRVGDPTVLRATSPIETALAHRRFTAVRHRGKFLIFDLDKGAIVVNPMLAGVFELTDAEAKLTRTTALSLVLDDGKDLRYRDDKRMGKVHVLDEGEGTTSV